MHKLKINSSIKKRLIKLSKLKYFNRWIIFSSDLFLFTFSSLFSIVTLNFLLVSKTGTGLNLDFINSYLIIATLASVFFFLTIKTHKGIIRHFSLIEILRIFLVSLLKILTILLVLAIFGYKLDMHLLFIVLEDFSLSILLVICVRASMFVIFQRLLHSANRSKRIFIYGADSNSAYIAKEQLNYEQYAVVGFLTREKSLNNLRIAGLPVIGINKYKSTEKLFSKYNVTTVLFPNYDSVRDEKEKLVEFCIQNNIEMLVTQPIKQVKNSMDARPQIKEIEIEDLLGRDEIDVDLKEIQSIIGNKTVLVSGAAGSIGSEIVRQLASLSVKKIILFDNAESALHNLRLELEKQFPKLDFHPIVGDVRSNSRVHYIFKRFEPQIVFHAAAYKHVPLMEENPCEAVQVNVIGTKIIANKSVEFGIEKFIMISTDKAVNPTNIMGASKRIAEIYTQSLGLAIKDRKIEGKTEFITTRFGNVLGSNGSVIPFFKKQIKEGGPVTVTHPDIIRYFMTIPEACRLVLEAASLGNGGEIFIFEMGKPIKIVDLAKRMISLAGFTPNKEIKIEYTGLRPGEKLYEELLNNEENTGATKNKKIKIAKVREYKFEEIETSYTTLDKYSAVGEVEEVVRLMKKIVPEFISKNSHFAKFDNKE